MAKKRQKRRAKLQKRLAQVKEDAGAILKEAVAALRRGGTERALSLAGEAQRLAKTPAEAEAARELIIEAHVRAGVNQSGEARLERFEKALAVAPTSARLRFYRGLCLWQLGRLEEAFDDLEAAADKPEARVFAGLARLALGRDEPDREGLDQAEANTLALVAGFLSGRPEVPTPLLGGEEAEPLWRALMKMARDEDATPLEELEEVARSTRNLMIKRFARYYLGVAALRSGDRSRAETAWQAAEGAGPAPVKLAENLAALKRQRALELASGGHYEALIGSQEATGDRVQQQALALAYEHQGYAAAQQGDWRRAVHFWREAHALYPRRELAQNLALAEEAREHWSEAAEAWRAMLRRRPRKPEHPDYLSDLQVAAIWRHAGQCYLRAEDLDEAIRCFKQALKYTDDSALRFELAEALYDNDQTEAAQNELERLLELEPNHKEALMRLASSYEDDWRKDATGLWRRVLELDPTDREVRDALARSYLEQVRFLPPQRARALLEKGLQDIPEHPGLLLSLALSYRESKKPLARELLERSYRASEGMVGLVGLILCELAHLEAEELFETVAAEQRQRDDLLPAFWLDNGEKILQEELGASWAKRLLDEGVALAEREQSAEISKASALAFAYEAALLAKEESLMTYYEARIRSEVPESGAPEYLEAFRLHRLQEADLTRIRRLLKEAERKARRAGDKGMLASIEVAREEVEYGSPLSRDLKRMFKRLRGELNV